MRVHRPAIAVVAAVAVLGLAGCRDTKSPNPWTELKQHCEDQAKHRGGTFDSYFNCPGN